MTRKRKTPPELARVIMERHAATIEHVESNLNVKRKYPSAQAQWLKDKTEAEIIAWMNGYSACLEEVMFEFNCYAGFQHVGPKTTENSIDGKSYSRDVIDRTHPEFEEWRRSYYTNGIAK